MVAAPAEGDRHDGGGQPDGEDQPGERRVQGIELDHAARLSRFSVRARMHPMTPV
jgi:hypothetical protein